MIERELGVVSVPSVYTANMGTADLDGDGAYELYVSIPAPFTTNEEAEILVLSGGLYTGSVDLQTEGDWILLMTTGTVTSSQTSIVPVGDWDGDGTDELVVLQPSFSSDPDATTPPREGRLALMNRPGVGSTDVSVQEYANSWVTDDEQLGSPARC